MNPSFPLPFTAPPMPSLPALAVEKIKGGFAFNMWKRIVAKRAIDVADDGTHFRVLHPTKGWRRVSKKRLGL